MYVLNGNNIVFDFNTSWSFIINILNPKIKRDLLFYSNTIDHKILHGYY